MSGHDVAIIGGGIVGTSAALHLRRRGLSVVLLERGLFGSQASGVNYGGVRRQGRNLAELPIAVRSREIWGRLPELVGTDCEFTVTGHLKLARTAGEMAGLEAYAERAAEFDLDLELVSGEELGRRYDYLAPELVGGSLCAGDGHANPRLVAPAFARAAAQAGATTIEGAEVVAVDGGSHGFDIGLGDGRHFAAHALVNAAGAWGAEVARQFGEAVPETVIAPNMVVTEPLPHVIGPNIGTCGGDIYLRQIERGNIIFGAGLGWADRDAMRARPLPERTAEACRLAVALVPHLTGANIIRTWSGIEGWLPDGIPVVGPSTTTERLFHAFGFCGHGFQLGPAIGAILAELVADGKSTTPISAFSPSRFSETSDSLRAVPASLSASSSSSSRQRGKTAGAADSPLSDGAI